MIILISGGASSGKSTFAENLCVKLSHNSLYIATMENKSSEALRRIEHHKNMRQGKGFTTLEKERDFLVNDIKNYDTILLECLGTLSANHLFNGGSIERLYSDIDILINSGKNIIFVSNDIGFEDISIYESCTQDYIKALNYATRYIAEKSDIFIEMVYGNPCFIKGKDIYDTLF